MAERGDLEIEEYVYREAGSLVHQHFGGSKRVSEVGAGDLSTASCHVTLALSWCDQFVEVTITLFRDRFI